MLIDQGYGEPMVHNGTKIELPPTDEAFVAAVEEQLNEWKVKLRAENVYMDTIPWEQERKQRDKIVRTLHREWDKEARMAAAAAPAGDPAAAPAADEAAPAADEPPPPPAVVVTGCCGRIGRAVANGLVEAGYTVYGFDRLEQTDVPGGLSPEVIYQNGTLAHRARLRRVIRKATAVVHLAACPDDAPFDTVLLPTNILGLMNVLSECESAHQQAEEGTSKLEVVVVASTGKLYASPSTPFPIKVNDPFGVVCNYGASKLFAEGASQAFAHRTSIPTTVLRFGWCPRTKGDLAAMREKSKENAPGEGMNEFLAPSDAASCVLAAIKAKPAFAKLFCQSHPQKGGIARFDISETTKALDGWVPSSTFPTDPSWEDKLLGEKRDENGEVVADIEHTTWMDELVGNDYTLDEDLYPREGKEREKQLPPWRQKGKGGRSRGGKVEGLRGTVSGSRALELAERMKALDKALEDDPSRDMPKSPDRAFSKFSKSTWEAELDARLRTAEWAHSPPKHSAQKPQKEKIDPVLAVRAIATLPPEAFTPKSSKEVRKSLLAEEDEEDEEEDSFVKKECPAGGGGEGDHGRACREEPGEGAGEGRGLCRRLRELRLGACARLDDRVACALNIRSRRGRARGRRGGGGGARSR